MAAGKPWLRDQASRDLDPAESQRRADAGEPFSVRFRVPEGDGETRFDDAVYGDQSRKHRDIEDFALLRPDGTPLYNHVVVCDDVHMAITDIIRGQDHLSNTHKQVLLYEAMGRTPPKFAHLPLINAPDRTKLSKRKHGEVVSVTTYRDRGFLPEAFRNFLALLGWSPGDDREVFSTEELLAAFTLEGIGRSNAILTFSETDPRQWTDRKALFINQQYMSRMPLPELLPKVEAVLKQHGLWDEAFAEGGARRDWFSATVDLLRARFITLQDFADGGRAFFDESFDMDPEAVDKNLKKEPRLARMAARAGPAVRGPGAVRPRHRGGGAARLRGRARRQGRRADQRRADRGHRTLGGPVAVRRPHLPRARPGGPPPAGGGHPVLTRLQRRSVTGRSVRRVRIVPSGSSTSSPRVVIAPPAPPTTRPTSAPFLPPITDPSSAPSAAPIPAFWPVSLLSMLSERDTTRARMSTRVLSSSSRLLKARSSFPPRAGRSAGSALTTVPRTRAPAGITIRLST